MNIERAKVPDARETEKQVFFDRLYEEALVRPDKAIEFEGSFTKEEFLDFVVREKDVLIHGSNDSSIEELEPRQANDKSKTFGNRKGVYAVEDPVLAIFYAIKDKHRFNGAAESGYSTSPGADGPERRYNFAVTAEMIAEQPWSEGVVYILPRATFEQGTDDEGGEIDEWASPTAVTPIAKIVVGPEDFRYLDEIKALEG